MIRVLRVLSVVGVLDTGHDNDGTGRVLASCGPNQENVFLGARTEYIDNSLCAQQYVFSGMQALGVDKLVCAQVRIESVGKE